MTRFSLLGINIDLLTMDQLTDLVASSVTHKRQTLIANHNLHSIHLFHNMPGLPEVYASMDYAHVDGMPLVVIGRSMGLPICRRHRIAYIDWLPLFLPVAARNGWRLLYVGSRPGVAERGMARFRRTIPNLKIKTMHGYFDTDPDSGACRAAIDEIARYDPDVMFVGMGMPRQEFWITAVRKHVSARAVLTSCGATMEYFAGDVFTPPRWAGQIGCEWMFRLVTRPSQLWHRYLAEPWSILPIYLHDLLYARPQSTKSASR